MFFATFFQTKCRSQVKLHQEWYFIFAKSWEIVLAVSKLQKLQKKLEQKSAENGGCVILSSFRKNSFSVFGNVFIQYFFSTCSLLYAEIGENKLKTTIQLG